MMLEKVLLSPLFWIPLLAGAFYFVTGYLMIKYPPKRINGFYGYRTGRSRQSQKHWDFAQKFSAILLKKFGVLCFPFCAFAFLGEGKPNEWLIILVAALSLFPVGYVIYHTEKMLKEF